MGEEDHRRVLDDMRLANGIIFPLPIILPVEPGEASGGCLGRRAEDREKKSPTFARRGLALI